MYHQINPQRYRSKFQEALLQFDALENLQSHGKTKLPKTRTHKRKN
jgi:hypothetical protein